MKNILYNRRFKAFLIKVICLYTVSGLYFLDEFVRAICHTDSRISCKTSMHLQRNLNLIAGLKGIQIIGKLFGVGVFLKQRGNFLSVLTGFVASVSMPAAVCAGDILLADQMTVECIDLHAFLQGIDIAKRRKRGQGKENAVGLFAAQTDGGYVSLIGIHIPADVFAVFILLTEQVVCFAEFDGLLAVRGEIHALLTLCVVQRNDNLVAEAFAHLQAIGVAVLMHVLLRSDVAAVHINSLFSAYITRFD